MKIDNLKIFTGRAHPALAQSICKELSMPLGNAVVESFPDSETLKKKDHIRGDDVFIIQPTSKPSNESVMELLIMIDAARRASAKRITAVLPFFGYARQDRKDQPRVPITAKLIANLLVAAGANRVLTLDLHATQIQGFFDIPCDHLYASPVIYDYLEGQSYINNLTVFSPDVGGLKRAQSYATLFDCPLGFIAKRRISAEVVEATSLVGEVEGRDILIVDDMTETAGTLTAAAKILKSKGAKSVRAAVTHAILTETAYDRLSEHWLDELIITDSTPPDERYKEYPITVLTIGHLLTEAILRIHNNMSVTSLFKVKGF